MLKLELQYPDSLRWKKRPFWDFIQDQEKLSTETKMAEGLPLVKCITND